MSDFINNGLLLKLELRQKQWEEITKKIVRPSDLLSNFKIESPFRQLELQQKQWEEITKKIVQPSDLLSNFKIESPFRQMELQQKQWEEITKSIIKPFELLSSFTMESPLRQMELQQKQWEEITGSVIKPFELLSSFTMESPLRQMKLQQKQWDVATKDFLMIANEISNIGTKDLNKSRYMSQKTLKKIITNLESQNLLTKSDISFYKEEIANALSIWGNLNVYSQKIIDSWTDFKDKQPFLLLIFSLIVIFYLLFIETPLKDVIKNIVFDTVNYNADEEKSKKLLKEIRKGIKEQIKNEIGDVNINILNQVRVTNRVTPVFKSSSKKSGRNDYIPKNQAVIIKQKKKNWSLVIYKNKKQLEKQGWIFTGNLFK